MQTGQQGRAVGGIGLIEQHPRVKCLGLKHAGGALRCGDILRCAASQPGIALAASAIGRPSPVSPSTAMTCPASCGRTGSWDR